MSNSMGESFERDSRVNLVASAPTSSSSSSRVTNVPARLLIATAAPARVSDTHWYSTISTAAGSYPSACAAPRTRTTSPWWSAPHTYTRRSNPRENLSMTYAQSAPKYVGAPFDRMSTRSLSSPNAVERKNTAPSSSYA